MTPNLKELRMSDFYNILAPAIIALLGTLWVYPKVLKIAIIKNLVDNPDARKLQRNPIPVMGGLAVFFGIVVLKVKLVVAIGTGVLQKSLQTLR